MKSEWFEWLEFVLENEMHRILGDFGIKVDIIKSRLGNQINFLSKRRKKITN